MRTRATISLVLVFCGVWSTSTAHAARLVRISVELDGKTVLESHSSDDGFETPYLVWRLLKGAPLKPAPKFQVEPEPGRADQAVLRGNIVVDVQYGAKVETQELPLVLVAGQWQVDPAWVEAQGPAGNLADEQRKTQALRLQVLRRDLGLPLSLLAIGGFAGLAVLCAILAAVVFSSRRKTGPI